MGKRPRRTPALDLAARDVDGLPGGPSQLFLGRWDEARVGQELRAAGLLNALAERGYAHVDVRVSVEASEHRLSVQPRGETITLIELRVSEGTLALDDPTYRDHGAGVLSVLSVHWLALQHPRGTFTEARPRLPGQTHPGLGLSKPLFLRVREWATDWGKDAVLNHPGYFHNARFYSPPFFFLSPHVQGRFEALCRDLGALSVAAAATAIERGQVWEEPAGAVLRWQGDPMAVPITPPLAACFASAAYRDAVTLARESVRFRVAESPRQT
jgi:hypothetical protein